MTRPCTCPGCTRKAERETWCYAHQPQFVERCERGEHDLCYEDGNPHGCCTCGAVKPPYWREIAPNTFMPAVTA